MRWLVVGCVAVVLLGLGVPQVLGSLVTVDEILYQSKKANPSANVTDPTALAGTVDMVWDTSQLTVILTNTSGDTLSKGAMNLLTGLGFTLPDGVDILSGDVSMTGSVARNFTPPGDDVGSEWAYTNSVGPVGSGHFDVPALSDVDTVLSALIADGDTQFAPGTLNTSPDINGVDFGLLMDASTFGKVWGDIIGGQEAIQDAIILTLNLSGTVPGNLVDLIDAEPVVLSFGSPDTSSIPEPSTLALLCMGVLVLPLYGRRKKR